MAETEVSPVLAQLRDMSRDPFMEVMARCLENGPEDSDFKRLARDKPRDWASTVKVLANLAGFSDRREIRSDVYTHMTSMTDAQLEEAIRQLEEGTIVDITDYKVVDGG